MRTYRDLNEHVHEVNLEKMDYEGPGEMRVRLVDFMGDDASVVEAARVSVKSGLKGTEKDRKLIKYLAEHSHMTPFEHVVFKFYIKCPLCIAVHVLRHRTFSYNMLSRRYTSRDITFYLPDELRSQSQTDKQGSEGIIEAPELLREMKEFYESSYRLYRKLIDAGVAREIARFVLPQGVFTEFYMTGNLRNYMHFVELRLDRHAQYEVQWVASAILRCMYELAPVSVSSLWWYHIKGRVELSERIGELVEDLVEAMEKEVMK